MKKTLLLLAGLSLCATQANAAILNFDDIPGGSVQNTSGAMPTYKGFSFYPWFSWVDVEGSSWDYGAVSGDFALVILQTTSGTVIDANGEDFVFNGLWAKKWDTPKESGGADSLFGVLEGYRSGTLIWSVNTSLNGSYEYYGAQTGLINELKLNFGYGGFLVDDLNVSPVPEPSSIALMLGGLGLVGFMAARRAKKKV